jgi:hypothetical protein
VKLSIHKLVEFYGYTLLIIFVVIGIVTLYIIKHKGKGLISDKVQFNVLLVIAPILCLPLWIDPVSSYTTKLVGTVLAIIGAHIYFYVGERIRIFIRHIWPRKH